MEKQQPKITLILHTKSGKDTYMYPSPRRMRKMLKSSLEKKLKNGAKATFRVVYGKAMTAHGKVEVFDNEIVTKNIADLIWAYDAFMDEFLCLPKQGSKI